jgi:hypothetical protein
MKIPVFDNGVFIRKPGPELKLVTKWYKFVFYSPNHKYADDLGYVHFRSKQDLERFTNR